MKCPSLIGRNYDNYEMSEFDWKKLEKSLSGSDVSTFSSEKNLPQRGGTLWRLISVLQATIHLLRAIQRQHEITWSGWMFKDDKPRQTNPVNDEI